MSFLSALTADVTDGFSANAVLLGGIAILGLMCYAGYAVYETAPVNLKTIDCVKRVDATAHYGEQRVDAMVACYR